MQEITYALLDVVRPLSVREIILPGSSASHERLRKAARQAFKGMPWRGSNEPPALYR